MTKLKILTSTNRSGAKGRTVADWITEYAKELCILNSEHLLENQIWVFANQYQKMKYLSEELDFVITDSPLLLSSFYGIKYDYKFKNLFPLIKD